VSHLRTKGLSGFVGRHFPALTSRDFLIFWIGHGISLLGTWTQSTTLPYLAYRISGRPMDLGLIGFSATLPTLLLALPAGVIVERLDKRKTVIVMQTVMMLQASALAVLTLSGLIQIWHIIVLAFLLGIAGSMEITARQSMLIELVGKPALPNAIALQATIFNLARMIGPWLSAAILVAVPENGEGWAFLVNAISFLFVILSLFFVQTRYRIPVSVDSTINPLREFKEGQRYVFKTQVVLIIIMVAALIGFFGFPFNQQISVVARDVLAQIGDTETIVKARNGILYGAQGVGALAGSFLFTYLISKIHKGRFLIVGQFVFSFALIGISFTRTLPLAVALIGALGWSNVTLLASMNTLVQLEVPDSLRGRVFSTYLWALQGVAPFGSLFVGWVAQTWGVPAAALVCGGTCLLASILIHTLNPSLRRKET